MSPKIAIVGAGPVGLCLAKILHQKGIDATIFEAEADPHARTQGGSLDLHPPTGQAAMKAAGVWDEYQKHVRYDGQAFKLGDRFGKLHLDLGPETDTGRPEIDRTMLRQVLLDAVAPESIQWGRRLARADPDSGTLHFADGSSAGGFDLIVGADGAWSRVRPLLTALAPFYTGVVIWDMQISDADARYPALGARVGRGSLFMYGEETRQGLFAQRQGTGALRVYVVEVRDGADAPARPRLVTDPAATKTQLLQLLRPNGWPEEYLELVSRSDEGDMMERPMYQLPVGTRWTSRRGVTLVGDAAHLQTPFTGEGVNLGLTDALRLAEQIEAHAGDGDLFAAVQGYEKAMKGEWVESTAGTWEALMSVFEPGYTEGLAAKMNGFQAGTDEAQYFSFKPDMNGKAGAA